MDIECNELQSIQSYWMDWVELRSSSDQEHSNGEDEQGNQTMHLKMELWFEELLLLSFSSKPGPGSHFPRFSFVSRFQLSLAS